MHPKKSLGQNFLTSEAAIFKMVTAAQIKPATNADSIPETIIEIGPGRGILTKSLLAAGARVIAIEKDHRLIEELQQKFANEIATSRFTLIEKDALEIEPEEIGLKKTRAYKIVANIPYYITGQILRKFLSATIQPSTMVILLQKEVVDRIIAHDKKESILSISIKAYGTPKKVGVVNRGSFFPAPNVDSAIISIENISKNFFTTETIKNSHLSEEKFFEVLKAGFAHKRKVLISNLTEISPREKIQKVFTELGFAENIRAEDLTPEDWKNIAVRI